MYSGRDGFMLIQCFERSFVILFQNYFAMLCISLQFFIVLYLTIIKCYVSTKKRLQIEQKRINFETVSPNLYYVLLSKQILPTCNIRNE